jgi:hypothetical protein
MGAIAADDERCGKLSALAFLVERYDHVIVVLDRRNE